MRKKHLALVLGLAAASLVAWYRRDWTAVTTFVSILLLAAIYMIRNRP